jgi:hypothetical protein
MTATATATATARAARPAARSAARPATTRSGYLRLVAARRSHAAKAPFVAAVVVILAAGLLGLLLLNTVLAQDAFRLHALQLQSHVLADQEQSLQRDVERLQSPQSLASRAGALGMVPGGPRAFLRLSDGKVLGVAMPGQAPVVAAPAAAVTANTPATKTPPAAKPATGGWVLVADKPTKPATRTSKTTKPTAKPTTAPSSGGHR